APFSGAQRRKRTNGVLPIAWRIVSTTTHPAQHMSSGQMPLVEPDDARVCKPWTMLGLRLAMCVATIALPAHVYAPYFETWTTDSLTTTAEASGARYFTLAFLATLSKTSCTLAWNGRKSDLVANGRYLSDIASLRAIGGDVIPSFGGWSADQRGTELADSCKTVKRLAAAYEADVTDYDGATTDMGGAAIGATEALLAQLHALWPAKTRTEIAARVGITLMPGVDDYPRGTEETSLVDAMRVYDYAQANGFDTLSIWSIQRDQSGGTWAFSNVLAPFTGL